MKTEDKQILEYFNFCASGTNKQKVIKTVRQFQMMLLDEIDYKLNHPTLKTSQEVKQKLQELREELTSK